MSLARIGIFAVASTAALVAGCATVLGDNFEITEPPDTTTGTGGTSSSSLGGAGAGGAPSPCALETHRCVPDPGAGWSEPFAIAELTDGCGAGFPTEIGALRDSINVGPSRCACTCGQPAVSCPSQMSIVGYSEAACVSGVGQHNLSPGQCYAKLPSCATHELHVPGPDASCSQGTITPTFGDVTWGVSRLACGAPAAGTCAKAAETCVPQPSWPFQGAICVLQPGNVPCPESYPNRTSYTQAVTDDRSCPSGCTCDASGARCDVATSVYASTDCSGTATAGTVTSSAPSCVLSSGTPSIQTGTPAVGDQGSCAGTDPAPTGDAVATQPVTACCT